MRVVVLLVAIPALLPRSPPLTHAPTSSLPATMANGANHCRSVFPIFQIYGLLNSQSHLSLLVFPASQEKSVLRVYSAVSAAIYTHAKTPLRDMEANSQSDKVDRISSWARRLPYRSCVFLESSCFNTSNILLLI